MLYVLVSMLCASCGSSGSASDSEIAANLQSSEADIAISSSDTIIGPGVAGYSLSQSTVPTIAAAQQLVQPSTDEAAPLLVAQLGNTQNSFDSAATLEANSAAEPAMPPDAVSELAALETELAALPQLGVLSVSSPETPTEPEAQAKQEQPSAPEITPVIAKRDPNDNAVSYQTIEENGLANGVYPTDDYYLAEYLYQNPEVCFWDQDTQNKTITPVNTPVPPSNSIYMPTPTGGDDTSMLEAFIAKNAGKSLIGQGTYKVKTLDIVKPVDIFNMPMVPVNGARQMVRISSPDVRIFNSPIDGKNTASLAIGFNVENGSDRFVLVNSGLSSLHHKSKASAAAVFVRGANDVYIVCNRFEDLLNQTSDTSKSNPVLSVWFNGRNEHDLSGGLVANNYASNHQANGRENDAEFLKLQNYKSVNEERPLRIFANHGYNAGKRLIKLQEGNVLALSNKLEWSTKDGPLGKRRLLSGFAVHFSDNVFVRNNRVKVAADGHFDAIFHTHTLSSTPQDNIHFDNNDIELTDNRDPNANSGPVLLFAMSNRQPIKGEGHEATNSSANDNVIHGSGSLKHYYLFRNGYSDTGGRFEHKNNEFLIPFYRNEYARF